MTAETVDKIISCEVPDKRTDPELHALVGLHMLHGPCGVLNPNCPCMFSPKFPGACSKQFPFPFCEETQVETDGYPQYRRPAHGPVFPWIKRNNRFYENVDCGWVVPYNPYLLRKYRCHLNVQTACSIKSVKYIYKYIYKGQDRCEAALQEDVQNGLLKLDEIQAYQDGRYLCAPEACSTLFGFETNRKSHRVQRLPVHLKDEQSTVFEEHSAQQAVDRGPRQTELLAYFDLNRGVDVVPAVQQLAQTLKYSEIPIYFRFQKKRWIKRKHPVPNEVKNAFTKSKPVIGRMHNVPIKDAELYSLRSLLLHVKGAQSYEHLRTVEVQTILDDGTFQTELRQCETFLEAAILLGLRTADDEWDRALIAGRLHQMPGALRSLFASILIFCDPLDPEKLWDRHCKYLWDERTWATHAEENTFRAYHSLQSMVQRTNSTFTLASNFRIPVPLGNFQIYEQEGQQLFDAAQGAEMLASLQPLQREYYDKIMASVESEEEGPRCFFLDGPGGSGKSYLYNTLTHNLRAQGRSVLNVASTGIAATLIGGMTAHKQFGIPVPCHENSTSRIRLNTREAQQLKDASVLIWDEATMAHKDMLMCLDRLLRDLMQLDDVPFGGKCLVLGGDFRQCLPVIPHGTSAQQASACLKACRLWHHVEQLSLINNIRAAGDPDFAPWLLRVGDGLDGVTVDLDHHGIHLQYSQEELIDATFGTEINALTLEHLRKTVILAPTNRTTLELNDLMLNRVPGDSIHRFSIDTPVENDEHQDMLPVELLHDLNPPGMPPHDLHLKKDGVYMLLRNMNIKLGLCNGSRFVLLDCSSPFLLKCQLIPVTPLAPGEEATIFFLPRINSSPTEQYPFQFQRKQFPILPAFAMTINKSQGGTFDMVGIDLSVPIFSHGQLYVALSRVRSFSALQILLPQGAISTRNHVYREILTGAAPLANPPLARPPLPPHASGHYHYEDALDAGDNDQFMHDVSPSEAAVEAGLGEEGAAETEHTDPEAHLPPPPVPLPPAPPVIVTLDFWDVIDSMTPEQRMAFMAARLDPQPETGRVPSPPLPPRRRRPQPSRRNPPRAVRHDNSLSDD